MAAEQQQEQQLVRLSMRDEAGLAWVEVPRAWIADYPDDVDVALLVIADRMRMRCHERMESELASAA